MTFDMLSLELYLEFGFDGENVIDDVAFVTNVLVRLEEVIYVYVAWNT